MKKLVVFDLDGTLAKSKCPMDNEVSALLHSLLAERDVAVISGGSYEQFQKQFLSSMDCNDTDILSRLYLFPTCSTSFYKYGRGSWNKVYSHDLSDEEKGRIFSAFNSVISLKDFEEKAFGSVIEDRGGQITFSALGQSAPIEIKKVWDPDGSKRQEIKRNLENYLPDLEIRIGGTTSIDITRKGIDKGYGIRQIESILGFKKEEILFIGDALFLGGNDWPVKEAGIECISVEGPEDTKEAIKNLIKAQKL